VAGCDPQRGYMALDTDPANSQRHKLSVPL
jgi:hypothetical protein